MILYFLFTFRLYFFIILSYLPEYDSPEICPGAHLPSFCLFAVFSRQYCGSEHAFSDIFRQIAQKKKEEPATGFSF